MILNRQLTPEERRASQRNHLSFCLINGASYMCLGENVVILLAVHLAAPSTIVALIGSMMYIGYLALPLGVRRTARVGAAACQADFWICRNMAALLIAASAVVARFSPPVAWGMIVVGSFLFYACRAAGCVLGMPLIGDIASREEVSVFIGANNRYFYGSGVAAIVAVAAMTHFCEGVWTLVGVIVFGAMCGFTSSHFIRGINESGAVREAAGRRLLPGMIEVFRSADIRRLSLAWFGLNLTFVMLAPISVLALRRGFGFSDTAVLVCAVAQFAAGCLISPLSGRLGKHLGPRFVLAAFFALFIVATLGWCVFPPCDGSPSFAGYAAALLLFAVIGVAQIATANAATAYFLMICPDARAQVPGTIAVQILASVGAGLCGSAFASGLLLLADRIVAHFGGRFGQFRIYFMLAAPIFALCWFQVLRLRTVIHDFRRKYGAKAVERAITFGLHHRHFPSVKGKMLVGVAVFVATSLIASADIVQGLECYGSLTLVDSIDCAADTAHRFRDYPVGRSYVTNILGSATRVMHHVRNEETSKGNRSGAYVSWRVGEGMGLVPNDPYLLVVDYPDDAPRTVTLFDFAMGTRHGYHTGFTVGVSMSPQVSVSPCYESVAVPFSHEWQKLVEVVFPFEKPTQYKGGQRIPLATDGFDKSAYDAWPFPASGQTPPSAARGHITADPMRPRSPRMAATAELNWTRDRAASSATRHHPPPAPVTPCA